MNILITGGAGYIGSILTPLLLEQGHNVTVLDNFIFKNTSLLDCCYKENLTIINGDCREKSLMQKLIKNAEVIIPLAAIVGMPACNKDKIATKTINYEAVKLICNLTSKDQRIIIPTTNSGYGIGEKGKYCTEKTPINPISLYGITKMEAEKAVLDRGNGISFRLATVFGMSPRMRIDLLVNDFVYRAVNDRAVVIFEGTFKRNYIHVRDVARVFNFAINNFDVLKNEVYNFGLEDANLSKIELCEKIKEYIPNFVYLEAKIGEDPDKRNYIVSNEKILKTGFSTKWRLDDGIKELIKGYVILKNSIYSNI